MDTRILVVIVTGAVVLLGTVAFSLVIARRHSTAADWQTGGRALPMYVVVGTQLATLMGGGVLVGHVGIGYENGWSAVTYGLLSAIGLIPMIIMARWLRQGGMSSLPDVLVKLYGPSRLMAVITIVMSVVIPFGWLISNLVAFGNLFALITGLSVKVLIPIFGLLCLGFVIPAGLTSVAWTDFVFGVGMLVLAVLTTVFSMREAGGWSVIQASVPSEAVSFPEGMVAVGGVTVLFWLFAVMPGNLTNQQVYQRVFAADSTRGARTGIAVAALLYLGALVWASMMGLTVHALKPDLDNPEMAMGWLLTQIPTWLLALFAAFIISTIMSTASSAVQSVVVNLTKDIYQEHIAPDADPKRMLSLSRWASVGVVAIGVGLAVFYQQALQWLVMTFAYSVSAMLMPILVGFALRRTRFLTRSGAVAGMLAGVATAGVAHASGTEVPYVAFGMAGSLVGLILVSAVTRDGNTATDGDAEERPAVESSGH
ncbi:sodium:solute symporter family protein [Spiractinospora alimapuensis]|uniref:sodium:solute symporter family protein n=1 Tax=Spiractinospora alimapuensis TaxID=2820884 RepID=UPI001F1ECF9F|nr:sodium:solute symporter family protein [Spiractinospora alimapuensis]QVQ51378.1 sodium:solute symporter family protein [Spiractinospora alimapuensis]